MGRGGRRGYVVRVGLGVGVMTVGLRVLRARVLLLLLLRVMLREVVHVRWGG